MDPNTHDVPPQCIVIKLSDQELQVLLINQRGLYDISTLKWATMQSIGQWLITKIICTRIPLVLDDPSKINWEQTELLDVKIDHLLEIPKNVLGQWKSRNFPSIRGMTIKFAACQQADTLRFDITLRFPHPRIRKKWAIDSEKELIDFSTYDPLAIDSDDEEMEEEERAARNRLRHVDIKLFYILSVPEILSFGSCEGIGEQKVSLNSRLVDSQDSNPEEFIWRLICRLTIKFKGSLDDPYHPTCCADDPNNWEINYDRRLTRDIRTVSGCVMLVTSSVIGSQLLFESQPTDTYSHRVVSLSHHLIVCID